MFITEEIFNILRTGIYYDNTHHLLDELKQVITEYIQDYNNG